MKSRIFGVLTCVTFTITSAAYLSFSVTDRQAENPTSRSTFSFLAEPDQAEKATSLAAVGWKGCKWCKKLKEETLPPLVEEGYDVRYVDLKKWKGPKVTKGPTLFYMDGRRKIVRVETGFKTPDQIKEYLRKPSLER